MLFGSVVEGGSGFQEPRRPATQAWPGKRTCLAFSKGGLGPYSGKLQGFGPPRLILEYDLAKFPERSATLSSMALPKLSRLGIGVFASSDPCRV